MNSSREAYHLLLTPREAAKALGVCEKTLWTYTQKGDIPSMRIGGSVRYSTEILKEWIEQQSKSA